MKISRLGVYGGTFDPVHNGHLAIARNVVSHCGLDRLLFVPSARPPHKQGQAMASPDDRYRMVELAVRDDPRLEVSDLEIVRPGLSYTVDTLEALQRIHGASSSIYLVIGADSLLEMDTWYAPDRVFDLSTVVAVPRPGKDLTGVHPRWRDRAVLIHLSEIDISSTDIRHRAGQGLPITDLVHGDVADYIEARGLYADGAAREG